MKRLALALFMYAPVCMAQSNERASASYCNYVQEQAEAQRDLLRAPSVEIGPIQPSTGTPPQMVFGVISSLANIRKSSFVMSVAKTSCELYKSQSDAQQHIYFALPSIEKEVLKHRLGLIQAAADELDRLAKQDMKYVEAQNLTLPAVYYLQGARTRLDMSRTAALTGITSPYVPELSKTPLRQLIHDKTKAEIDNQRSSAELMKQNGWDIQLNGGIHKQLGGPASSAIGAYGTFSLTYSFGRKAANRHLDSAVDYYAGWKLDQYDDVTQQASVLKKQLDDTIDIQISQLEVLAEHNRQIQAKLESLKDSDTNSAMSFRNELRADQIMLTVELRDVEFRIAQLQQYLQDNF